MESLKINSISFSGTNGLSKKPETSAKPGAQGEYPSCVPGMAQKCMANMGMADISFEKKESPVQTTGLKEIALNKNTITPEFGKNVLHIPKDGIQYSVKASALNRQNISKIVGDVTIVCDCIGCGAKVNDLEEVEGKLTIAGFAEAYNSNGVETLDSERKIEFPKLMKANGLTISSCDNEIELDALEEVKGDFLVDDTCGDKNTVSLKPLELVDGDISVQKGKVILENTSIPSHRSLNKKQPPKPMCTSFELTKDGQTTKVYTFKPDGDVDIKNAQETNSTNN